MLVGLESQRLVARSSYIPEGQVRPVALWQRTPLGTRLVQLAAAALGALALTPNDAEAAVDALRRHLESR